MICITSLCVYAYIEPGFKGVQCRFEVGTSISSQSQNFPVSSTSNSEHGREKIHLAFVIDPASPDAVENRNAIKGRDRLEDPGDGAHKNRSFL